MASKIPITVAHGDGIGPEIMNATLRILEAAGASLDLVVAAGDLRDTERLANGGG